MTTHVPDVMQSDEPELSDPRRGRPAILIDHPIFSAQAFGQNHPLSIRRHSAFIKLSQAMNWPSPRIHEAPLADFATLSRFHCVDYLSAFERSARHMLATAEVRARYNIGTAECPLFEGLWTRARASVGGSILAADLALQGYLPFNPGGGTHHGRSDRASGFCYFNDPVFAILRLLDAHHGDGVEAAFAGDPRVHLLSLHEEGRWPGTGGLNETPCDRIINVPLPRGINDSEYLFIFDAVYRNRLKPLHPDAVVVTCGADSIVGAPLSSMNVSNRAMTRIVGKCIDLSNIAIMLGCGGYNPWTTARFWCALWAQANELAVPGCLSPAARGILEDLSCDLIDREDISPEWLSCVVDPMRPGPIREDCIARAEKACGRVR